MLLKRLVFCAPVAFLACSPAIERNPDGSCPIPKDGLWSSQVVSWKGTCQKPKNETAWISKDKPGTTIITERSVNKDNCSVQVKGTDTASHINFEGVYYYYSPESFAYTGKVSSPTCYGDVELAFDIVR